jgi:hypothetical protein
VHGFGRLASAEIEWRARTSLNAGTQFRLDVGDQEMTEDQAMMVFEPQKV